VGALRVIRQRTALIDWLARLSQVCQLILDMFEQINTTVHPAEFGGPSCIPDKHQHVI
jgi:hypothetical protein